MDAGLGLFGNHIRHIYIYTHIHAYDILENTFGHPSGRNFTRRVPTVRFLNGEVFRGWLVLGASRFGLRF